MNTFVILKFFIVILIISALIITLFEKFADRNNLMCTGILFKESIPKKIKILKNFIASFYIVIFITVISLLIYSFTLKAYRISEIIAILIYSISAFALIEYSIFTSFAKDLNAIIKNFQLKKELKKIKDNKTISKELNIYELEELEEKELTFYDVQVGKVYAYKRALNKEKTKLILGIIVELTENINKNIVNNTVLTKNTVYTYNTNFQTIFKSLLVKNISLVPKKYIDVIDEIFDQDFIKKEDSYIYETLKLLNTETGDIINLENIEVENAKMFNILKALEKNSDEEVVNVCNILNSFLNNNTDYEKEDILEIIDIYITDEIIKQDFIFIVENKNKLTEKGSNSLKIIKEV